MSKLELLIKDFNKTHKDNIAFIGVQRETVLRLPFSSPRANYMLYGGLPQGRIIEFAGAEGSGKTTTALDIVANAQKLFKEEWENKIYEIQNSKVKSADTDIKALINDGPKKIIYVDSENTLDVDWATKLGVDVDSIYLLRPQEQNAEEIFDMVLDMIRTGEAGLVVIDSIATLVPKAIYEESMEKSSYCGIAKSLTRFCNMVTPLLHKHRTTLIAINQVREDINNQWNEFVTPGGKGFKHHCSVRLMFQKGSFIDENGTELKRSAETPVGNIVMMSIVKTKICSPDRRTGSYTLKYATGIDTLGDIIDTGIRYGLIIQAGGWFSLANTITGEVLMDSENKAIKLQGRVTLQNYLLENITVLEDIKTFLKSAVEG